MIPATTPEPPPKAGTGDVWADVIRDCWPIVALAWVVRRRLPPS